MRILLNINFGRCGALGVLPAVSPAVGSTLTLLRSVTWVAHRCPWGSCLCWRSQRGWGQSNLHPHQRPRGRQKEHQTWSKQHSPASACPRSSSGELARREITEPFAVQSMVIPDGLAGHDLLVQSPTGSGKTLAFGIPLIERLHGTNVRPSALVLAPTRELAIQIVADLRQLAHARALSIAAVYGGAGIVKQAQIASRAHILVATPGRLLDLIDRRDVSLQHTRLLVLDEADRMLDMGFRPVVDRIVKMTRSDRQTLLFSATLGGEVGRVAAKYTHDARRHEYAPTPAREGHVEHRFVSVSHDRKDGASGRRARASPSAV